MTSLIAAGAAAIVLALLWALVVGQPAATQANLDQIAAQGAENASLRATVYAFPKATPQTCYAGSRRVNCLDSP